MEFAMSFLSNAFRRKSGGLPPWAALDQESLRISAAMEHVQDHGNLDSFAGNQNEKLALMLTALVITFNFLADVGQRYADPRTREGRSAA